MNRNSTQKLLRNNFFSFVHFQNNFHRSQKKLKKGKNLCPLFVNTTLAPFSAHVSSEKKNLCSQQNSREFLFTVVFVGEKTKRKNTRLFLPSKKKKTFFLFPIIFTSLTRHLFFPDSLVSFHFLILFPDKKMTQANRC